MNARLDIAGLAQRERAARTRELVGKPWPRPTAADEADLRLYFDHGVDFFAAPSNFGHQLEQAELFSVELRPCRECGGSDAYQDGDELVAERPGTGFVLSSREHRNRKLIALCTGEEYIPGDLTCPKCQGIGWRRHAPSRRAPTVQQTGSSVVGSDVEPGGNIERMERFGRVDRILYRVNRRDPLLWCVLAAYYAPDGSEEALWVLTAEGSAWFEERRLKTVNERSFFDGVKNAQAKQPTAARGERIATVRTQSRAILQEAWGLWVSLSR